MQDIRLVGNDGEYLNLETQSGDKFRLVLDDNLRAAVKRDSSLRLDQLSITPREIQDAIRAGASAEEVASENSVPLDYVEKFALTVVDEIGHIIASARAVRIAVAADRYNEATQREFGEVVAERISAVGGEDANWSAIKVDGLPWQITVSYSLNGSNVSAIWSFDQRKLILSPENEAAVKFAPSEHSLASPAVQRPALEETQVIPLPKPVVEETPAAPVIAAVPDIARKSAIEELTRASVSSIESNVSEHIEEHSEVSEAPTATADLLEALRKKRAESAKPAEVATESPVEQALPASAPERPAADVVLEEVKPDPVSPAKKGRPSMPSWDEIVFGTKSED